MLNKGSKLQHASHTMSYIQMKYYNLVLYINNDVPVFASFQLCFQIRRFQEKAFVAEKGYFSWPFCGLKSIC